MSILSGLTACIAGIPELRRVPTFDFPRPTSHIPSVLLCFVVAFHTLGCTMPPRHATLIDVPFIPQEQTNHCGVVALAMALDHFKIPYEMDRLTEEAFSPILGGANYQLLADTAVRHGLNIQPAEADAQTLRHALLLQQLPIIYVAPIGKTGVGHFCVVTGISDNLRFVRIHDVKQADHWLRFSRLRRRTTDGRYPALFLYERDRDSAGTN